MVNYNNKERKGLRGVPTQCVGFLLALIVIFNCFPVYAWEDVQTGDTFNVDTLPSFANIYGQYCTPTGNQERSDLFSCWLFCNDYQTDNIYYLVFTKVVHNSDNLDYDILYYTTNDYGQMVGVSAWSNYVQYGINPGQFVSPTTVYDYFVVYKYQENVDNNWVHIDSTSIPNGVYYYLFDGQHTTVGIATPLKKLLAYQGAVKHVDVNLGEYIKCYDFTASTNQLYNKFIGELPYTITLQGTIIPTSEVEPEPDPEPEYNNILTQILSWLQQIKNGITDFFTNFSTYLSNGISVVQGWLSNLGATIGGFFTTLWSNLSTAFSNIGTWFTNLGNRISGFFIALVNDIKGLFIPDDDFFTDYKADVEEAMQEHFGALYESVEVTADLLHSLDDLFDYERPEDLNISFPRLRFAMRVNSSSITHRIELFDISNSNIASQFVTSFNDITSAFQGRFNYQKFGGGTGYIYIMDLWDGFITASFALYLFYFLKNQLNRILSNSFNVGGE